MNKRKISGVTFVMLMAGLLLTGCGKKEDIPVLNESIKSCVDIAEVKQGTLSDIAYYELTAVADTTEINADATAYITKWNVLPGDRVKKGEVLAELEAVTKTAVKQKKTEKNTDYETLILRTRYQIEQKKYEVMLENGESGQAVELQKIEAELAGIRYRERLEGIGLTDEEVLAETSRENENDVAETVQTGGVIYLKAPADGTITYRIEKLPGDLIYTGTCLLTVTSDDVVLRGEMLSESRLAEVNSVYTFIDGEKVTLERLPYTESDYAGKFARYTCDKKLRMGADVGAFIESNTREDVVYVPIDALNADEIGYFVTRIKKDLQYEKCYVEIGKLGDVYAEIYYGIDPGEKVVVSTTAQDGAFSQTEAAVTKRFSDKITFKTSLSYFSSAKLYFSEDNVTFGRFLVSEGDYVKAGTTIAECEMILSDEQYEKDLEELAYLKENFRIRKAAYDEEVSALTEKAEASAGSEKELLILEIAEKTLIFERDTEPVTNNINSIEFTIAVREGKAKVNTLVAPIDGYIDKLAYVKAGDKVEKTRWMAMIHSDKEECLTVTDSKKEINGMSEVTVVVGDKQYEGYVAQADNLLSEDLATGKAYILLKDKSVRISSLQSPLVVVERPVVENALVVNRDMVNTSKGRKFVIIIKDNVAKKRYVTVGPSSAYEMCIITGIEDGDQIARQ